jgi:hypothetical protein
MRHRAKALLLLAAVPWTLSACDPATAVVVPVLVITATWQVEGDEGVRTFRFDADQDDSAGLTEGTFTGREIIATGTSEVTNELTGWWEKGQVRFTLQRPGGNIVFTATFQDDFPNRLTFLSPNEVIVVFN